MEIFIFDTSFQLVKIIDSYESFIWTERYSDYGDFELYLPVDADILQYLKADYYVEIRESDRTMIIEDIQIDMDVDNGPSLKISGHSLESILDRRIVWKQTLISNKTVDEVIKQLLDENIGSGAGDSRCVDIFEYVELPDDHYIKTLKISQIQFTGDNLFDVVKSICDAFSLGFRITLGEDAKLYFELFVGVNRSYTNDDGTDQLKNPHVVFSPTFDNLLNSSYLESYKTSKTITLVAGEGEGVDRVMVEVPSAVNYVLLTAQPSDWSTDCTKYYTKSGETYTAVKKLIGDLAPTWKANTYYGTTGGAGTGLSRRELFTDARDLTKEAQQQAEDGTTSTVTLTDEEYNATLTERGKEKLAEYASIKSFEGAVDPSTEHKYGSLEEIKMGKADYSMGDIVQVENEYGMGSRCRVTEFIRSEDISGSETYPTFTKI